MSVQDKGSLSICLLREIFLTTTNIFFTERLRQQHLKVSAIPNFELQTLSFEL
jgi:hypothetical protein